VPPLLIRSGGGEAATSAPGRLRQAYAGELRRAYARFPAPAPAKPVPPLL